MANKPDDKPPLTQVPEIRRSLMVRDLLNQLGPLEQLQGRWHGSGFNLIWRPFDINQIVNGTAGHDHFLELNLTHENLQFDFIDAPIPNRGLLQPDITLFGLHYLQQISDSFTNGALHLEPGIWINVPATANPSEPPTVVRMASIPHGTALVAEGTGSAETPGPPTIATVSTVPFVTGAGTLVPFPQESVLTNASVFRTSPLNPAITQAMVDNPNSLLTNALAGQTVDKTLTIHVTTLTTGATVPNAGGGVENIAFLLGAAPGNAPNANAVQMSATFWIEKVKKPEGGGDFLQLQYTQTVLLNFNKLSWPHVSVATLRKSWA